MRKIRRGALIALTILLFPALSHGQGPNCTLAVKGPANVHPTSMSVSGCQMYGGAYIDLGNGQTQLATYWFDAVTGNLTVSPVNIPSGYAIIDQTVSVTQRGGSLVSWNVVDIAGGGDRQFVFDARNPGAMHQIGPIDSFDSFAATVITQSGISAGAVGGIVPAYGRAGGTPTYLTLGPSYSGGIVIDATDVTGGTLFGGVVTDANNGDILPVVWRPNGTLQMLPLRTTPGPVTGLWISDSGQFVYYLVNGELHGFDMITSSFDVARDPLTGQVLTGLTGVSVTPDGYIHGNGPSGMFSWKIGKQYVPFSAWVGQNATVSTQQWLASFGGSGRLVGVAVDPTAGRVAVAIDKSINLSNDVLQQSTATPENGTLVLLGSGLAIIAIALALKSRIGAA